MNRTSKLWRWAIIFLILLVAAQAGVLFALRTQRMHGYLIAHLERAFGRPVQVSEFTAQLFPLPRLQMNGITVGEDPAFGNEYFLRAEAMQASLRWMGLLRGHFEFGTMSLTRPSLILVQNANGKWNLEGWLPPAEAKSSSWPPAQSTARDNSSRSGPQASASPSNYLERIEFDDGRINFKTGNQKRAFAFTSVSGSVEQQGPGRWQLRLQAKPWRSGVVLQSAGVLYINGDVAGTSARLQPAQLQVHWDKVSLADLFRLITDNDSGVRGEFGLDGTASVGVASESNAAPSAGKWKFEVEVRGTQIHRWDLTERSDNPRVSVHAKGQWDLRSSEAIAEEIKVELPHSNLRGAGKIGTTHEFPWSARIEAFALEAQDALAWYRAFHPDVADGLALEQSFKGEGAIHGWPLRWDAARLTSGDGLLHVPGIASPLRIGALRGGLQRHAFVIDPVRISALAVAADESTPAKVDKTTSSMRSIQNWADLQFAYDGISEVGFIRANGRLDQSQVFFTAARAFGKTVNHGWELSGPVSGAMDWNWDGGLFRNGHWNGSINFAKSELQAAGLNQPMALEEAKLEWKAGLRTATIASVQAFGTDWNGTVAETRIEPEGDGARWQFRLHADHLDAAELDRWAGPRARPNWLQRLLPSLLGNSNVGGNPSELLRRVSAVGELSADIVSIEKLKLSHAHAKISLQDLHLGLRDAEADWAGGSVRGSLQALFSASPRYEVHADVDHVNLAQLPWISGWADRWNGIASARIQLSAVGIGREELLQKLLVGGEIDLKSLDFRGWDVVGSLESGELRTGVSHWSGGAGGFEVKDRVARFTRIQLDSLKTKTALDATLDFADGVTFAFSSGAPEKRGASRGPVLEVSGNPEAPAVVIERGNSASAKP